MSLTADTRPAPSIFIVIVVFISIAGPACPALASPARIIFPVPESLTVIETGLGPVAVGSDSIWCGDSLLRRGDDYMFSYLTGRLVLERKLPCDRIELAVFRLPGWLTEARNRDVPQGRRLVFGEDRPGVPKRGSTSPGRVTLSGNKSFSFAVNRHGDGQFSQGLTVDFDALVQDQVHVRGSVSDRRAASTTRTPGEIGGTTYLAELDKYFFEMEGRKMKARGGDIVSITNEYLPVKRVKGMGLQYQTSAMSLSGSVGRPAGRFVTTRFLGIDGRQGPYQVNGNNGLPTRVIPGSETVYIDGRRLEGGADKHYLFDYAAGRITFQPGVVITSRSRIDIDFEAAEQDYEQSVTEIAHSLHLFHNRVTFQAGGRRESDNRDRMRFLSFSPDDLAVLAQAGDSARLASGSGITPDSAGAYVSAVDSAGRGYYRYVGPGNGDHTLIFSFVGDRQGDYFYRGDGVYEYAGPNGGSYASKTFLPLPEKHDFLYGALALRPDSTMTLSLDYQASIRDRNLFSPVDDADNWQSLAAGDFSTSFGVWKQKTAVRFRQVLFDPAYRINDPDDNRQWALPDEKRTRDELRFVSTQEIRLPDHQASIRAGYLSFKDDTWSYRLAAEAGLFQSRIISPRFSYLMAASRSTGALARTGLYERYETGVWLKVLRQVRFEINQEREIKKETASLLPRVERYSLYGTRAFIRNTVLSVSRRIDFTSTRLGYRGPQLDQVTVVSEEAWGPWQVSLSGAHLIQKRIDSDRPNRRETQYATMLRFQAQGGWLSGSAAYRRNRTSAQSLGYRYLRVTDGTGQYRYEEGQYLFDPDGDYIRVQEEQGGRLEAVTGEKSHYLAFYPGRSPLPGKIRALMSPAAFRLQTEVYEEAAPGGGPGGQWLLPWYSAAGRFYINRSLRQGYSLLLFPQANFYILNLVYDRRFDERDGGATLFREAKEYSCVLKQALTAKSRLSLSFTHKRRQERGIGYLPLALLVNDYGTALVVSPSFLQVEPGVNYLVVKDRETGGEGNGMGIKISGILRRPGRGEARLVAEYWHWREKIPFNRPEYLITDNHRFGRSATIQAVINYDLGKSLRLTLNATDRIFQNRPAEFTGRGELIATF